MRTKKALLSVAASAFIAVAYLFSRSGSPASADIVNVLIMNFAFQPPTVEVPEGSRVTWLHNDSAPHTTTSNSQLWDSPIMERGDTFSFIFTSAGTFTYFCRIHPFMKGTVVVTQAEPPPPQPTSTPQPTATPAPTASPEPSLGQPGLASPPNGSALGDFNPTLSWTLPQGATQYHLVVTPANNDGPGISIIGNAVSSFSIPPPPQWYGLLPDMGYTWMVRVTDASVSVGVGDPSWGPWSEAASFHTPKVSSGAISEVAPAEGTTVDTLTPTLQWRNSNPNLFYYEVQVSKDSSFNTNPATATAMVYWELRHGGVTNPPNSYTVPSAFPLEPNTRYFWRVRPRVQGDGTPVDWSKSFSFRVVDAQVAIPTSTPTPIRTPTPTPTATPTPTPTPSGGGGGGGYDGYRIAFESRRDGNDEIYVINADGSGQARLTNNPATDNEPQWSPVLVASTTASFRAR